ncbi:MAG: leucine--tRNA ligase [Candidatus Micrarchaeaceae archaeon]
MLDYNAIEQKWQSEWEKAKIFESDIDSKEPLMVTAAFPYVNAPQHIGHMRTYGTADVLARYKRMRGFNVIYPMGFHGTGTPILAFAKRLQNKDEDLIKELELFHIPKEDIEKMSDPLYIANYFVGEIENGMHKAGYSIDWRRKLFSIDPTFSKFVEWQFGILNKKGLLTQGRHPVGWCPVENNAVGMHDTKHDVEPEIEEETLVAFKVEDMDAYLLCATYRPETLDGVTNIFVDENAEYSVCTIEGMNGCYYISSAAVEELSYQFKLAVAKKVAGRDLLAIRCINPRTGAHIPVLHGFFVKESVGTGLVMSVPAHSPFDYAALERLKQKGNETAANIKPIKVLEIDSGSSLKEGYTSAKSPATAYLSLLNADAWSSDNAIEEATKLEYKEESRKGRMTIEGFKGMTEPEARDAIKRQLAEKGLGFSVFVLVNSPVYCRAGHKVVVKIVDNQWFLNYGNKEWKGSVTKMFTDVKILPDKCRKAFESSIEWIDLRAVARAQGLGTRFPIDNNYIIESLSDSTIYMSLYTIMPFIRGIDPEKLKPELFEYIFLGNGNPDEIAKNLGLEYSMIKKARDSFTYWYRNTSRHSSPDLIFNHLTMYLYNHVAIFPKEYWPKQIVVNGTVLSEGEKMSKSLGNIIPLTDGIKKYGADPLRFVVVAAVDLFNDSNYSPDAVNGVRERLEYIYNVALGIDGMNTGELSHIDYWLYSKLNRKIELVTASMEALELRVASTEILYNSVLELKRYFARGGNNGMVVKEYISAITLMLCPISPHISEEIWHMLGGNTFASLEKWPIADRSMINDKEEAKEAIIDAAVEDIKQVLEIVRKKSGKNPKQAQLIVADNWKREANNLLVSERNLGKAIEVIRSDPKKVFGDDATKISADIAIEYLKSLSKRIIELKKCGLTQEEEVVLFEESRNYIENAIGIKIYVEKEAESKSQRSNKAMPGKPSIDAE